MGRPNFIKPLPSGTSRRGFFTKSGSAAVALATASTLSLARDEDDDEDDDKGRGGGVSFEHGVASGDPLARRVILWTRVTPSAGRAKRVTVRYVVATDPRLRHVVERGELRTGPDRDYTVKVDAAGLRPGTTYYYRFESRGVESPVGRTRTLPVGATPRLRLAVASCSNHAAGYFNAYRRIAERADLDAVIHLGDYLYEYGPNQFGNLRTPEPPNEMVTLSDYRTRHAQYKRDADSQAVHRQHPMICIWDDHEITNDAWQGGAQNHTEGAEGAWVDRVNVGLQAYYEWMPVRVPDRNEPRRNQRAFAFGDLIDLAMLEERLSARSQQLPATIPVPGLGNAFAQVGEFNNPARTLLGDAQEAWLAERLRKSDARWKLIGQGVMFAQLKAQGAPLSAGGGLFFNSDQWDGYQPARDRIYKRAQGRRQQLRGEQLRHPYRRHPQLVGRRSVAGPEQPERCWRRLRRLHRRRLARRRVRRHVGQLTRPRRPAGQHRALSAQRQPALQVHRLEPPRLHAARRDARACGLRVVAHRHGGQHQQHRNLRRGL